MVYYCSVSKCTYNGLHVPMFGIPNEKEKALRNFRIHESYEYDDMTSAVFFYFSFQLTCKKLA